MPKIKGSRSFTRRPFYVDKHAANDGRRDASCNGAGREDLSKGMKVKKERNTTNTLLSFFELSLFLCVCQCDVCFVQ